jgi:hypothetical protein
MMERRIISIRDSQRGTARPSKDGTERLFQNSVTKYQLTRRSVAEDRRLIPHAKYQMHGSQSHDNLSAIQVAKKFSDFFQDSPLLDPPLTHEYNSFPHTLFI